MTTLLQRLTPPLRRLRRPRPPRPDPGPDRARVRGQYDGVAGALTALTGLLTGHEALAGRLLRRGAFDVGGAALLDAACGNGRYARFLMRRADPDALVTTFDLSPVMLHRARARLRCERVSHAVADLTRLPYADGTFDAVVCGWALEHLKDPRPGLAELRRVLAPGGALLLMTTEDTLPGRACGWLWRCRAYRRGELRAAAGECGLTWGRELYFTRLHRLLGLGGIVVELGRAEGPVHG